MSYLDNSGLAYFWQKIKAYVQSAVASAGNVPGGGSAGQVLAKHSATDNDTEWKTLTASDVGAAAASHSHAISDVTNLQTTLNGKAASSHSHAIADVTNLQTTLDGKASTGANTFTGAQVHKDGSINRDGTVAAADDWCDTPLSIMDKDGELLAQISVVERGTNSTLPSGQIEAMLRAFNEESGTQHENRITAGIDRSGNCYYSVTDKAKFRTALGLGSAAISDSDDFAAAGHSHSEYFSDQVNRTANTVLAAPNGSAGHASFRKLVADDIPALAASKITSGTVAAARLSSARSHRTSHVNIPVTTTAPTAAKADGWNYDQYSDGLVHAWGTFLISNTAINTKLAEGFYWNNTLRYLALPIKAAYIMTQQWSHSLGGSGGFGAYAAPGGNAHSVWSGATFSLPFYIARPYSSSAGSWWFSVDVWYMKA